MDGYTLSQVRGDLRSNRLNVKDLAARLGVNRPTFSTLLNGDPMVELTPEWGARIWAEIVEMQEERRAA